MTAINPIPVVRNNLPDYRAMIVREREKLIERIAKIDAELVMLDALSKIISTKDSFVSGFDNLVEHDGVEMTAEQRELRIRANEPENVEGLRGRNE